MEECLTDLSWLAAPGYIIFLSGTRRFAQSSPDDMKTAVELFNSAATHWKKSGVPFYMLLSKGIYKW
jgi:hypothetical protein